MRFVKLGRSDLNVSAIGLGGFSFGTSGWMVPENVASAIIKRAMDLGINYIDTANVYSKGESENIIGNVTEDYRDDVVISTKVGGPMNPRHYGFSRKEVEYQIENSMKRLRTDYIDIYFLHTWFDHLDVEEMVSILNGLVERGKTRYYGLSNPNGHQLAEIDTTAALRGLERPQIVQNHYNAIYREDDRDAIPYCRMKSITFSPFSPIAAGFLSGKYEREKEPDSVRSREYPVMKKRYFQENDFDIMDIIREVSVEQGVSNVATSLAFLLEKDFLPVLGVSKASHLDDAEASLQTNLTKEQMERIDGAYLPHREMKGTAGY